MPHGCEDAALPFRTAPLFLGGYAVKIPNRIRTWTEGAAQTQNGVARGRA